MNRELKGLVSRLVSSSSRTPPTNPSAVDQPSTRSSPTSGDHLLPRRRDSLFPAPLPLRRLLQAERNTTGGLSFYRFPIHRQPFPATSTPSLLLSQRSNTGELLLSQRSNTGEFVSPVSSHRRPPKGCRCEVFPAIFFNLVRPLPPGSLRMLWTVRVEASAFPSSSLAAVEPCEVSGLFSSFSGNYYHLRRPPLPP